MAGDYRIGMDWVEVLTGGEVETEIIAGNKVVRSVRTRKDLAPQRLGTGIENLPAGDAITVTATPESATCRPGCQTALTTPAFPQAAAFGANVADELTNPAIKGSNEAVMKIVALMKEWANDGK